MINYIYLKTKAWPIIALLLFIAIAVFFWWLTEHPSLMPESPAEVAPDTYLEYSTVSEYDQKGYLQHKLTADKALHFTQQNTTLLEHPVFIQYQQQQTVWTIQANHGNVKTFSDNTKDRIDLAENVIAKRYAKDTLTLFTSALSIYPQNDYAETKKRVNVESANQKNKTEAQGMQVFFTNNRVLLSAAVRSIYEPN